MAAVREAELRVLPADYAKFGFTMEYIYKNYVKTLSDRFLANISSIEVGHNFEYGAEFEIVVCETLRAILPENFGICRGYVVDSEGNVAGDDIIIYEQSRFPTLALRTPKGYARKEFVPIEAVYCYIEVKHTLLINDDKRQSLSYAWEQTRRVKELCSKRKKVDARQIGPYSNVGEIFSVSTPDKFPTFLNPVFGVILSRQVGKQNSPLIEKPQNVNEELAKFKIPDGFGPDIVILGSNNVILPVIHNAEANGNDFISPFFVENLSTYYPCTTNGLAFGIGLASLMYALDWIQLGVLPWRNIILDGLK